MKSSRKSLKFGFSSLTSLFLITLLGYHFIPRFPFGPFTLYQGMNTEQNATSITYSSLSNETTHPFKPHQNISDPQDHRIIAKYFDARSCLVKSQRNTDMADLRLIDWNKFRSYFEIEICLWRIFSSYENTKDIQTWLEFHGFKAQEPRKNTTGLPFWRMDTFDIFGNRKTKTTPSHFPAKGIQLGSLIGWKSYDENIRARVDEKGRILDVHYSLSFK